MYSLRHIALTDKISQHVSIEVFTQIYPPEVIDSLIEHDPHVQQKQRRVRHFVPVSVVWFLLLMALWTRLAPFTTAIASWLWMARSSMWRIPRSMMPRLDAPRTNTAREPIHRCAV